MIWWHSIWGVLLVSQFVFSCTAKAYATYRQHRFQHDIWIGVGGMLWTLSYWGQSGMLVYAIIKALNGHGSAPIWAYMLASAIFGVGDLGLILLWRA